ncbi:probable UTP18 Possible U3 snoRNP protein involved in maturation of pre-18S rRNA [Rhynchosporium agropyri]|uniref:Probable UTP18 Possible U3 snoRNP protein involved in maturation of pre-18S rRNA n=1 Tax=Rhynchosporium agropyri TaxID=914238 RepID=A0A1E1LLE6_9HELO|nr:probable UTP18 Possible U3 snoRNP protein involved in maturation of pre-18S rRNA [Rhynchosporium agropyri]
MPRQRSKKLSASRGLDSKAPLRQDIVSGGGSQSKNESENESDNESDIESEEEDEKDEEEEELDRLVFGDGAGFKAMLGEGMDVDSEEEDGQGIEENGSEAGLAHLDDADLFFLDSGPSGSSNSMILHEPSHAKGDAPAWEDSDDDRLTVSLAGNSRLRKLRVNEEEDMISGGEYSRRLRTHFERLNNVPAWAQARPAKRRRRSSAGSNSSISSDGMDVDTEDLSTLPLARLLQSAGSLTRTPVSPNKRTKLRPEVLDIQQTRSIADTQSAAISSLSFHPEYPILLSSGSQSTLYLHHIDPTAHPIPNPLLTAIKVGKTPLHTSAFLNPAGEKIFFSGRRKFFHVWDLPSGTIEAVTQIYGQKDEQKTMERFKLSPCGRYMALVGSSRKGGGIINILNASTTQWVAAVRVEGANGVADFAWWSNGEGLTALGKGGEVAEWSVSSRSYVARWIDDGHAPTVITLGGSNGPKSLGGDRWVVIGSQSGIVNIYDRRTFVTDANEVSILERPQPKKSFDQFSTPTSNLVISPDGQLLAFSSSGKKDALRLVHLPSCTVYRNWPTDKTPLGRITAVAFGRQSNILAVGNKSGKIRMWEIRG